MTEKEFKKIINISDEKQKTIIPLEIEELLTNIQKHLTFHLTIAQCLQKTVLVEGQKNFEIVLGLKVIETPDIVLFKTSLNEIENSLLYLGNIQILEKNYLTNTLKITYLDYTINFSLRYIDLDNVQQFSFDVAINRIKLLEKINSQYTLFKNTLRLVHYFINQENIKNLNDDIILTLLWYGLQNYAFENKYYSYLNILGRAIDDFASGKVIQVSNYFLELEVASCEKTNEKYIVIDPLCPFYNLAVSCTEQIISEYRRLRKKLTKECEEKQDTKNLFDSSLEVVIDVNPRLNNDNTYMWSYDIIGKNLNGCGGVYDNDVSSLQTAILKATFKALKLLVDNQLTKKRIVLKCDMPGILTDSFLTSDENKSRMKTIKSLIENHKLNVIQN